MGEDIVTVRDFILSEIENRIGSDGAYWDEAQNALAALNRLAAAFHERGQALTTIGYSLVCAPTDYAAHNARELLLAGEIARAVLGGKSALPTLEEALEAAARALARQARTNEMEASGFDENHVDVYVDQLWREHLDRARHCVGAYLQAEAAWGARGAWLPIETAPNGMVLIANTGWGAERVCIAFRRDYAESGFVKNDGIPIPVSWKPTHWQPLPSAPDEIARALTQGEG